MSYHSKSIVVFGHLLNTITKSLTEGLPVQIVLDEIQEQFAAETVVLGIVNRNGAPQLLSNSTASVFSNDAEAYEHAATVAKMMESHQYTTATEQRADNQTKYTLTIFRDGEAKRFDNEESALVSVLVAQIAQALEIASRIENTEVETAVYSQALARMNVGVIIVDDHGQISTQSQVAERLLKNREGIQIQSGTLRAVNASEDRELQAAIRKAAQSTADASHPSQVQGVSLSRPCSEHPLGIILQPAKSRANGAGLVAVFVRDCHNQQNLNDTMVRQIFNLTPAEAHVTLRLTSGMSLEATANSLDISRNTARAHLRSIFAKNGISRQTELVRLMLNSAVPLGDQSDYLSERFSQQAGTTARPDVLASDSA